MGGNSMDKLIVDMTSRNFRFSHKTHKLNEKKYSLLVARKDISLEIKKKLLINGLYDVLVHTFPIIIEGKDRAKLNSAIKHNISIARALVDKLIHTNYYLKTIKISKSKKDGLAMAKKGPSHLNKKDMTKLDYHVYILMKKIIHIDEKSLKIYEQKAKNEAKIETEDIKDIGLMLRKQSDILGILESKLPPAKMIDKRLFSSNIYKHWIIRIFALLTELMESYKKERILFTDLGKVKLVKAGLKKKISQLIKEKEKLIKIKDAKIIASNKFDRLDKDYEQLVRELSICLEL